MAIIRVRGGNAGIAEYLREGQKQGRAFNRDELDMRVCLEGNLALTENIINAIPDKNQDRYLHITISFRENEVPVETLEQVVKEYKSMFLAAYKDDEVNFYAEAHLPKIKSITDRTTGEEKERKPHIHIVIPKQNLLTGGALDPVGLYKHHERYHDAIQEKLNQRFNLESPKDFVRVTDDNQAQILSRVKADTFKGFRTDVKKEVFALVNDKEIKSYNVFIKELQNKYSEVRIRNKGTANEYLAIKTNAESNYINLKSPLFQRQYIEERRLEKPKLSLKQVDKLIDEWQNRVSKEIKYINKASKKVQHAYRAASAEEKREIILNRERGLYEHTESSGRRANREQGNKEPGNQNRGHKHIANTTFGLSEVLPRELVSNLDGYEHSGREREYNSSQAKQSRVLLREVPVSSMADGRQQEYEHHGLRWSARDPRRVESVTGSIATAHIEKKTVATESELAEFKNIRQLLSGQHLLNRLSNTHGIDINQYAVKKAKDGSDRISTGKLNLNVSDFLTKEMKFTWSEAKSYLRQSYDEQLNNEMAKAKIKLPKEAWREFNQNYRPEYFGKIKELRRELNYNCKVMRYETKQSYFKERAEIFSRKMTYAERKAALSVAVFNKLRHDKEVRQYQYVQRNLLSRFEKVETEFLISNYIQNREGGNYMGRLSDVIGGAAEKNAFSPFEPEYGINLKRHYNEINQNEEFNERQKKRLALNDLTPSKQDNGDVKYKTSLLGTAFIDKGDKIEFPTLISDKDKIALGLELAAEKYKGKIQLTGMPGFKEKAIEIAAERGLEVEFRPKKYQERFEELKQQFAQERAERSGATQEQANSSGAGSSKPQQEREAQSELTLTGFKARDLSYNELSRDSVRELAVTLSERNISFKELAANAKTSPDKSVGELIEQISTKPELSRSATGLELHVTTMYDQESNRTKILVNDLPMDMYIQTASEIAQTDPDVIRMPLLANDELSQFTPQQLEQGYAEGEVSIPAVTINENGRSVNKDIRVEFEAMENDSTAYRVIVNGQPMKEIHKPEQGGNIEQYEKDMAVISSIKKALEERGISTMSYFSDAHNSPTAQVDRDIRKAEMELAKEQIRYDQYVKSGNTETAKEHKAEVLDYLKDKIATAKEARENAIEAFAKNGSSSEQAIAKEMVIVASKLPKDFLLGGDGKAYNDAFTPKPFQASAPQREKYTQDQPKPSQQPKISFDR
ncbi:relaxase [Salmonella enterica]|nr:relaxase [Salmonella enterica subsp. enterica serovar Stanley]EBK3066445.1 relaxase [Salmonella enterica]EBX3015931.1 relaxase [Salmonella enterica subsp. enterica serovar Typhimurium]EEQ6468471.1 relaxase [Escherichia coli]EEY6071429.1 relaxase [Salmonella enterica subsp. enterica serovar Plymouth]EHI6963381.1 relaxase [Salmonella enterica subsp. enterica serovar Enteritidis]HEP0697156.1 relaxase [Enterobacter hormaechei subsp. steigerwaltii]